MNWIKISLKSKYRLILALSMLVMQFFLMGYAYFSWVKLSKLKVTENNILQKIKLSQIPKVITASKTDITIKPDLLKNYLPSLYSWAQQNNTQVKTLHVLPNQKAANLIIPAVEMSVNGKFSDILGFLLMIDNGFSTYLISHISLQLVSDNEIELKATILLIEAAKQVQAMTWVNAIHNPFCTSTQKAPVFGHVHVRNEKLSTYKLVHFKQVGFIQIGKQRKALVKLPNNQISEVSVGDILGREQARVAQIEVNKLKLVLPNNANFVLGTIK